MLEVGSKAPDFDAESFDGRRIRLRDLRGRVVVLYFFPKAFTPICTVETGRFRDNYAELSQLGAEVVGVSTDRLDTQCEFGKRHQVNFPLLADPQREIARAYGVLWPMYPRARRVTYVIGDSGVIELAMWHEFQVSKHLDGVFRFLQERAKSKLSPS